ncbi:MAG: SpoIID/LytB domain-containing protein [Phycisphaeraceae bacterium]
MSQRKPPAFVTWFNRHWPPKHPVALLFAAAIVAGAVVAALLNVSGCESTPPPIPTSGMRIATIHTEPMVRVRIKRNAAFVDLAATGGLRIGPPGHASPRDMPGPIRVTHDGQQFIITPATSLAMAWPAEALSITPISGGNLLVDGQPYPHRVNVHSLSTPTQLDAINHLPMEAYLPGVLNKELYAAWELEAFRAQAIAARSYAINNLSGSRRRHYDLESTTASQAYSGATAHSRARQAVEQTRGIVLAFNDAVLPAYYSACSGGTGQDADLIFPNQPQLAPLRGFAQGEWGKECPYYRWTVVVPRDLLSKRIAGWGMSTQRSIGSLQMIREIRITATNAAGRPTKFEVVDESGKSYVLGAEDFRFACNYDGGGLPELDAKQMLRSSHVAITVTVKEVLMNGAGYGHGVGMDQYGAQAMAKAGHAAQAILTFYYPGADLRKVY